ncbi:hypothetical protein BO70DRAFT_327401 [Aspergillus heteromorphus CBS 117.55]|uniref:Teneurin-like YD-shell domain-containing protein n=1 Tax=Aspergillus heteromorphus CBS 117.55 TaxID=1448321 RepID=A0A317X2D5_9EURO|nr:uncharacterized protein BO70DRAFT_327401 [Aspergillus heteromorphus CBS 117.55]PWY92311.1 hypothetical protein BO70DRAFT_327401 [Aspergillus heteromorphus CBS 117.55]
MIYSQGFNFDAYVEKGVDPRTGQYTCAIALYEVPSSVRNCPPFKLVLHYNPLNGNDIGLGRGWSFILSSYDHRNAKTLSLSTGENYHVTESASAVIVNDQKLQNFVFQKKSTSNYQITHKSGLIEVLTNGNNVFNTTVTTDIYGTNGRSLKLVWVRSGDQPRLSKVQEDSQDLVTIDYTDAAVTITQAPGTNESAAFTLVKRNSELVELRLPLAGSPSWKFTYGTSGLTNVTNPAGGVEDISYKANGHLLPRGAPVQAIPYVISHTARPLGGQPPIVTTYSYSDFNFLGYGGGLDWRDGEDNLYRMPASYQYTSTVQVVGGATTRYTYNKFHLVVSTQQQQGTKASTQTIAYYALSNTAFANQPAQYQLPKTAQTAYRDTSTGASRTETTEYEFDNWGNPTREKHPSGITTTREYYPAAGEIESGTGKVLCPADPHGFQRYLKLEAVTPAASNYQTPTRAKRYTYLKISAAANALTSYLVATQQLHTVEDGKNISSTECMYIDQPQARDHSRLQRQVARLLDQYVTTHEFTYTYTNSSTLKKATKMTTFDGHATHEDISSSLFSGLTLSEKDHSGIETTNQYDHMGRLTQTTTSPGTIFASTERTDYSLLDNGVGCLVTVTDPKGVQTRYFTDGLERLLRVEAQDDDGTWDIYRVYTGTFRAIQERSYNAQDQCIEEVDIDWLRTDAHPTEQRSTRSLTYDDWGQVSRITKNNGAVNLFAIDPITMTQTVGAEGEGQTKIQQNAFDTPASETLLKRDGSTYTRVEYAYDGIGRRMQMKDNSGHVTQYTYDSFDRVIQTTWPDGHATTTQYAAQSTAALPVAINLKGSSGFSTQTFDGLDRLIRSTVGGRTTTNAYAGVAPVPSLVTSPKGGQSQLTHEPALDFSLTSRVTTDATSSYQYDKQTADLLRMANSSMTTDLGYYPSRLLSHETNEATPSTNSAQYVYSQAGRLQKYTDVHGQQHTIQYDPYGRPQEITLGTLKTTLGYDLSDRVTKSVVQDGTQGSILTTDTAYDEFGREIRRVVQQGGKTLYQTVQSYSDTGLVTARDCTDGDGITIRLESFQYDNLNRLTDYQCQGTQPPVDEQGRSIRRQGFAFNSYDSFTQTRTAFADGSDNIASYTYSPSDPTQLIRITNTHPQDTPTINLEYDANGCLTRDEQGRTLVYDASSRLAAVYNQGQKVCEYVYDAVGRLMSQKIPNQPDTTLSYRDNILIAVTNGTKQTSFSADGGQYWGEVTRDGGSTKSQLWASDAQKSVSSWLENGEAHHQQYTPYGFSSGSTAIGFTGQWRDPVTGWYHLGNGYRVYNPRLKLFHSPDSWAPFTSGEINPYAYCLGDPINRADPNGHFSWRDLVLGVVGVVVGITVGVLTAGVGVAIGIGIGIAAGVASDVVTGAIYDVASGKAPTWGSVGTDALFGLIGGVGGELLGRGLAYAGKAAVRYIGREAPGVIRGALRTPVAAITETAAGRATAATTHGAVQVPEWVLERLRKGLPVLGLRGGAPAGKKAAKKTTQTVVERLAWTWDDARVLRGIDRSSLQQTHLNTYYEFRDLVKAGSHPSEAVRTMGGDLHFERLSGRLKDVYTIRLSQEHRVAFTIDARQRNVFVLNLGGHYPKLALAQDGAIL